MQKSDYLHLRRQLSEAGEFRKSDLVGATTMIAELSATAFGLFLLTMGAPFSWTYFVGEIWLGCCLFRCFVLAHECGHGTLFRTRALNTGAGTLMGVLSQVPYIGWRNVHYEHHKWVGVVDKDPTSAGLLKAQRYSPRMKKLLSLCWKCRLPLAALGGVISAFWLYPMRQWQAGNTRQAMSGLASDLITVSPLVALFITLGMHGVLVYWVPAMLVFYVLFEYINLTHHSGLYPFLSDTHPEPVPLHAQDVHCRTAVMPEWLSLVLCYHFNLHTEHHFFPSVPWHRLPALHRSLREQQGNTFNDVNMISYINLIRRLNPFDAFVDSVSRR